MMFRDGNKIDEVKGADPRKLQSIVEKLTSEIQSVSGGSGAAGSSSSAGGNSALGWRGAGLPRGYSDVTDQVEIQKSELLNYDEDFGAVRTLVDPSKPGGLSSGKMAEKDWVVSDTDEQLLLFTPFMSMVKLHTLQVCALPQPQSQFDLKLRGLTFALFRLLPSRMRMRTSCGLESSSFLPTDPTTLDSRTPRARRLRS
jgi:hypothetical protein